MIQVAPGKPKLKTKNPIIRVCGALIRDNSILMVRHEHSGRSYWTLPGGSVEADETPEAAVKRELKEETTIEAETVRMLFDDQLSNRGNICRCFLMKETKRGQKAVLGYDPEEAMLPKERRMLKDTTWLTLENMASDSQISRVIKALSLKIEEHQ
ncbi:MAG: NUDIX hydrolase [Spirochaetes bacterium]|nr:NUDIX hydrolase [Spirochaetota bacterium]